MRNIIQLKQAKTIKAGDYVLTPQHPTGILLESLPQNYFSKQEAMRIIGIKKSAFFYWVGSKGIEQVVIGKISLVRKDDVMAKSRAAA